MSLNLLGPFSLNVLKKNFLIKYLGGSNDKNQYHANF